MADSKQVRMVPGDNPNNWTGTTILPNGQLTIEVDGKAVLTIYGDGTTELPSEYQSGKCYALRLGHINKWNYNQPMTLQWARHMSGSMWKPWVSEDCGETWMPLEDYEKGHGA